MIQRTLRRELLRGSLLGLITALLGSLIFSALAFLVLASRKGAFSGVPTLEGATAVLGYVCLPGILISFGFSFVPAALGGMVLAGAIRFLATKVTRDSHIGFLVGAIVGAACAGTAAFLSLSTVLWSLAETPETSFPLVLLALGIGAFGGGLVGRRLSMEHAEGV